MSEDKPNAFNHYQLDMTTVLTGQLAKARLQRPKLEWRQGWPQPKEEAVLTSLTSYYLEMPNDKVLGDSTRIEKLLLPLGDRPEFKPCGLDSSSDLQRCEILHNRSIDPNYPSQSRAFIVSWDGYRIVFNFLGEGVISVKGDYLKVDFEPVRVAQVVNKASDFIDTGSGIGRAIRELLEQSTIVAFDVKVEDVKAPISE